MFKFEFEWKKILARARCTKICNQRIWFESLPKLIEIERPLLYYIRKAIYKWYDQCPFQLLCPILQDKIIKGGSNAVVINKIPCLWLILENIVYPRLPTE